MKLPVLVFDIETVADIQASTRVYDDVPTDVSGDELQSLLAQKRIDDLGHDFPRLPLHEIVCLSGLWITKDSIKLFTLSQDEHSEEQILEKLLSSIDKHSPTLVSWNGKAFDVPVIAYRAMLHKLTCVNLFDQGWHNQNNKYHNYQNRYHDKHTDLMDVFARFNPKYFQKLDLVAKFFDLPGKQDSTGTATTGHDVAMLVANKDWENLAGYCESDVLNTWLIYLRWLLLIGQLNHAQFDYWLQKTQNYIQTLAPKHEDFTSLIHSID